VAARVELGMTLGTVSSVVAQAELEAASSVTPQAELGAASLVADSVVAWVELEAVLSRRLFTFKQVEAMRFLSSMREYVDSARRQNG
jgi:hypothetical protein